MLPFRYTMCRMHIPNTVQGFDLSASRQLVGAAVRAPAMPRKNVDLVPRRLAHKTEPQTH
jgi:hypothetical protein